MFDANVDVKCECNKLLPWNLFFISNTNAHVDVTCELRPNLQTGLFTLIRKILHSAKTKFRDFSHLYRFSE